MNIELFKGTAYYYAKYRAGYPQEFFDYIMQLFKLDGTGRFLDLGCGTGQLAIPFAKHFKEVIGVDPEQEMLDEAERGAHNAAVKNIHWMLSKAEDIDDNLGIFQLTGIGTAFHWMDRKTVLQKIYNLTQKGGGLVIASSIASPGQDGWRKDADKWKEFRKQVVKKYLGERRRAGNSFYEEPKERFTDTIAQSPFGGYQEKIFEYTKTWDIESVINHMYSTSFSSRRLLGDRIDDFERELKAELLKCQPDGIFVDHITLQVIISIKQ